jgi:hypothetical protein
MSERTFVARYRPGVIFTPKPGFLIAPFVFLPGIGLFKSVIVAALMAAAAFMAVSMWYSAKRKRNPPLVLSAEGLAIESMKPVPWSDVAAISRAADERGRPALNIDFRKRGPQINASPLWKITGSQSIVLHVSLLADRFEDIEDAFDLFMGG